MNPKAWDLYHLKLSSDNPQADKVMARFNELQDKGFTLKLVNQDELEDSEEKLEPYERFVDDILEEVGIPHIYYPKPGMENRVREALKPFAKEVGGTDNA